MPSTLTPTRNEGLESFINRLQLSCHVETMDRNEYFFGYFDEPRHYICILRREQRKLVVYMTQERTAPAPKTYDVLTFLYGIFKNESTKTFEEWCNFYGFGSDSRRCEFAHRQYREWSCIFRDMVGRADYEFFLSSLGLG